ncbi:MAG TPA: NACHT domain-containing protein [Terracidiphilus sp.]|nr:NACHT domain-containing protein [Terracidiphilus sp.]
MAGALDVPSALHQALASEQPHILLFGDPGSGKSTLLRRMASLAWNSPHALGLERPYIPMLVRLGSLSENMEGALSDWLWEGLCRGAEVKPSTRPPDGFFTEWPARTGFRWLLLFDAFDEVPETLRQQVSDILYTEISRQECLCVITSRPAQGPGDDVLFLCPECTTYEILPLTSTQQTELADRCLGHHATSFKSDLDGIRLNASKRTPLFITIAASVYAQDGSLPGSRIGLYERLVDSALNEARHKGLLRMTGRAGQIARFLIERIAIRMTESQDCSITSIVSTTTDYLQEALSLSRDEARAMASETIPVLGRLSGVFSCDEESAQWWHPTIREYLAACEIERDGERHRLIDLIVNWDREPWSGVALFTLAIIGKRGGDSEPVKDLISNLFERALDRDGSKENGRTALFLSAAMAEGAVPNRHLEGSLIGYLADSASLGGKHEHCRHVYDELANSGRSPIDLLGRLLPRRAALNALYSIVEDESMRPWARKNALIACIRGGVQEEVVARLNSRKGGRRLLASAIEVLDPIPHLNERHGLIS